MIPSCTVTRPGYAWGTACKRWRVECGCGWTAAGKSEKEVLAMWLDHEHVRDER